MTDTSTLIRKISANSDTRNDLLLDFLEETGLTGLREASPEQLCDYIRRKIGDCHDTVS